MDARKLLTLEDFHRRGGSPTETLVRRNWPYWSLEPQRIAGVAEAPVARAEVNHGRWIVHCPMPGCTGAQLASITERRFFCIDCLHLADPAASFKWLRVEWPGEDEVATITAALLPRPMANRNWGPPETAMQLRAENAAFLSDQWVPKVFDFEDDES